MDTKFSVAVHLLILLTESESIQSSDTLAQSVGTNPSYIRKILSLLVQSGIVKSRRGAPGYTVTVPPDELTLLDVYKATAGGSAPHILDIHKNPNDRCIVGRHISNVLTGMFDEIESVFAASLAGKTLSQCTDRIRAAFEAEQTEGNKAYE